MDIVDWRGLAVLAGNQIFRVVVAPHRPGELKLLLVIEATDTLSLGFGLSQSRT